MNIIAKFLNQLRFLLRVWATEVIVGITSIAISAAILVKAVSEGNGGENGENGASKMLEYLKKYSIFIIVVMAIFYVMLIILGLTDIVQTVKTFITARNILMYTAIHEKVTQKIRIIKNCLLYLIVSIPLFAIGTATMNPFIGTIIAIGFFGCKIIVCINTVSLRNLLDIKTTKKI